MRVLREELHFLLAGGAALVQFDEPVLTEVVLRRRDRRPQLHVRRARRERRRRHASSPSRATRSIAVVAGLPRDRVALHVCRGNWTPDESVALAGDYRPLVDLLTSLNVGTYFLELAPRAPATSTCCARCPTTAASASASSIKSSTRVEDVEEITARVRRAVDVLGRERVLLNPDCGFATFADNPVTSAEIAEKKLDAIVEAAARVR